MTDEIKEEGIKRGKDLAMEIHLLALKWAPLARYSEFSTDIQRLIQDAVKSLTDYLASGK